MNNDLTEEEAKDAFSWYPGHIAKAERLLREKWLPLVDVVVELLDARVPLSSQYPERDLFADKPILTVYNKADLSDLTEVSGDSLLINAHLPHQWKSKLKKKVTMLSKGVLEKLAKSGRKRKLRLGICGLPNVGKSTFLNAMLPSGKKAKTGNLPGVTRQLQLVESGDYMILDSPGILPLKFGREQALRLAICNLLPNKFFEDQELTEYLRQCLRENDKFKPEWDNSLLLAHYRSGKIRAALEMF